MFLDFLVIKIHCVKSVHKKRIMVHLAWVYLGVGTCPWSLISEEGFSEKSNALSWTAIYTNIASFLAILLTVINGNCTNSIKSNYFSNLFFIENNHSRRDKEVLLPGNMRVIAIRLRFELCNSDRNSQITRCFFRELVAL